MKTQVYDVIHTFKHEHLICTSKGLVRRNLKVDEERREFIMTKDFPHSEYKDSFEGKEVYQIVPVDSCSSMYAVHFKPHMIALYDFSQQRIMKNFSSFPTLKSI